MIREIAGVRDPLVTPVEWVGPGREEYAELNIAHNLCVIAVRLRELTEALEQVADCIPKTVTVNVTGVREQVIEPGVARAGG